MKADFVKARLFPNKIASEVSQFMCGIVGFTGNGQASKILLDGLEKLEYRGYDSVGIAVIHDGAFTVKKTPERIQNLKEMTGNGDLVPGNIGIGHTRWATHGSPSLKNAHPHLSQNGLFAVVHNGIIENYLELRRELKALGYHFKSETDSEAIAHLLEHYYEGDFLEAVSKTVHRLSGSYALGILCVKEPETLIAVRHSVPLIVGVSEDANYIASDVTALVNYTKKVIYIDDGDLAVLTPNKVDIYNRSGQKVEKEVSTVNWDISAAEKGGYDHFMMKEIHEQPKAIEQTVECRIRNGEVVFDELALTAGQLKSFQKIDIVACGSAYHAGVVGKYVLEELLRLPVYVDIASEYRYRNPIVDSKTLVIVVSQSGETADTLAALREAKHKGAHVLSIVNVVGSSIAKEADDVLYTWAGPEIAVATTKGYSTQLSVLYLFGIWAAARLGTRSQNELHQLLAELRTIPEKIEQILEKESDLAAMAKKLGDPESLFFIGRNIDYAVALEASLKLKEISYIHSEAYAAGELKHGTISLIDDQKTVIALSCTRALSEKMLSNIKEIKARHAKVLTFTHDGNTLAAKESDEVFYLPETHPLFNASLEVIPFQIYAYYVALYKGCDIDKPRNLAKSVTVE